MTPTLALILAAAAAPLPRETPVEAAFRELGLPAPAGDRKHLATDYLPDGVTTAEIERDPDRYPLRAAVLEAVRVLRPVREFDTRAIRTPCLSALDPANPAPKIGGADFRCPPRRFDATGGPRHEFQAQREAVASHILDLKDARVRLAKTLSAGREVEPKRWAAHGDLLAAELEYHLCRAKERARVLSLDRFESGNGAGWVLVPAALPAQDDSSRRTVLVQLTDTVRSKYPDTPWATAAETLAAAPLGFAWEGVRETVSPPRVAVDPFRRPGGP